jgi:hypothetical protein
MSIRGWMPATALLLAAPLAFADLTMDQKVSDFTQLAGLYARHYGPYEAKRDLYGFDLFDLKPWMEKVRASKTDLEFLDICTRYVASLRDSHDGFSIRSNYEPFLPIGVDVYDGKVLIDGIDRVSLPITRYPFRVGDEILSIDGKTMEQWIQDLDPYTVNGASNPVSRARIAANLAIDRYQGWFTTSPLSMIEGKTTATVVILRQTGDTETYEIEWQIFGTPYYGEGPIPPFRTELKAKPRTISKAKTLSFRRKGDTADLVDPNPWGLGIEPGEEIVPEATPSYMEGFNKLTVSRPDEGGSISPFGSMNPLFNPPAGFRIRLGARAGDFFISGTFPVGTKTVGFIRIPTMSPSNANAALTQFAAEILTLQSMTDGLVVDVMANGGGSLCYAQALVGTFMAQQFRGAAYHIRATQFWVGVFSNSLSNAKFNGSAQWIQDLYGSYLQAVTQAMSENRGMTGPIPICGVTIETDPTISDGRGNFMSYTKPVLVLTDNFTLSAAESFAMFLQDEKRATVLGTITDGGGGNVNSFNAGAFSESNTRITQSLITRKNPVAVGSFPAVNYYDGVGIAPDIEVSRMTKENLLTSGAPFVQAFTSAIAALMEQ